MRIENIVHSRLARVWLQFYKRKKHAVTVNFTNDSARFAQLIESLVDENWNRERENEDIVSSAKHAWNKEQQSWCLTFTERT